MSSALTDRLDALQPKRAGDKREEKMNHYPAMKGSRRCSGHYDKTELKDSRKVWKILMAKDKIVVKRTELFCTRRELLKDLQFLIRIFDGVIVARTEGGEEVLVR